ncbi:MAG: hypothetical protein U9R12_06970 [Candidatus Caldatribacteriota bacterium]|nr:hypothetical protein [Candidatus Caldatribacteriota bacterium]
MMVVVVLEYVDGSVHFHKIPKVEDVETYLMETYEYCNIHWMEVLC